MVNKEVTSITLFRDAVGIRMSITYSEINEQGQILSDNKRTDRVLTGENYLKEFSDLQALAQTAVNALE